MAATVTATVQTTTPPRVVVTVLGLTGATAGALYRLVGATRTAVRPAPLSSSQVTSGSAVVVDQEAPFGVPVSYVVNVTRGGVATDEGRTAAPVTLIVTAPWITDPITGTGFATNVVTWPELTYAGRVAVVPVGGAFYPIVESDVMVAATSSLTLYTDTNTELGSLRATLNTGKVVLLRPECEGVEAAYLAITQRVERRRGDPGKGWERFHELGCQEVAMPSAAIAAVGDTLGDLNRVVPGTLQDIANRWPGTLLDIATTNLAAL